MTFIFGFAGTGGGGRATDPPSQFYFVWSGIKMEIFSENPSATDARAGIAANLRNNKKLPRNLKDLQERE